MAPLTPRDLAIDVLGACDYPSPLRDTNKCIEDADGIIVGSSSLEIGSFAARCEVPPAFERAGARPRLFFDPAKLACGIVTCGGLCPGENDVIRSVVLMLTYGYGVKRILGFRYGYAGLRASPPREPMVLTPDVVESLHGRAGTLLASSRGQQDAGEMVDTLAAGHGHPLHDRRRRDAARGARDPRGDARRGARIAVVGVPKTIDNDIAFVDKTFGYDSAVEVARDAVDAGHTEAIGARNGISVVKLMGRDSRVHRRGGDAGEPRRQLLPGARGALRPRGRARPLRGAEAAARCERAHAVIVVAEGAGQSCCNGTGLRSGTPPAT